MSFELDEIYFLENYETLLIIKNHIYLSNRKYFSVEHFKNERYSDKNLIEIKAEEILKINFNDLSEQVKIETKSNSFQLIFFNSKMIFRFVSSIEPFLILEKIEKDLSRSQKMIPLVSIFLIIIIISVFLGVDNNFILVMSFLFTIFIYLIYKIYGNSKNIEYAKPK